MPRISRQGAEAQRKTLRAFAALREVAGSGLAVTLTLS